MLILIYEKKKFSLFLIHMNFFFSLYEHILWGGKNDKKNFFGLRKRVDYVTDYIINEFGSFLLFFIVKHFYFQQF